MYFKILAKSPDTFDYTYASHPQTLLETNEQLTLTHASYIFTDFQTNNESGTSVAREYEEAAKNRNCPFISIILSCQPSENERRMRSPERLELVAKGKGMLLDTTVLDGFKKRGEIHRFGTQEELELDITDMLPAQAAGKVLEYVQSVT